MFYLVPVSGQYVMGIIRCCMCVCSLSQWRNAVNRNQMLYVCVQLKSVENSSTSESSLNQTFCYESATDGSSCQKRKSSDDFLPPLQPTRKRRLHSANTSYFEQHF